MRAEERAETAGACGGAPFSFRSATIHQARKSHSSQL